MSGIQIDVQARSGNAERELANINQSLRNIEKTTAKTSDSLKNMFKGLALTATSALSLNALKNISTEFTNLSNKIATVTGRTKELTAAQEALFRISEDTRGSLAGTVATFSSFGRALKGTGASTDKILQATKAIQEAVAISGSSAESANAAIIQLGQGLSAGALRGEELNSVMEQAPRIAQAIADELKVTTGQLRLIAAEGKLTSDVVFNAILKQAGKINKEFGVLTPTLTQGTDLLTTSVKIYISELDQGLGLSTAIGTSLFNWAKRIKGASKNAFELGTQISFAINQISSGISSIAGPLGTVFKELGKQALKILPEGFLTRTLKGDANEVIRQFDDMTGGMITSFQRFSLFDSLRVESDVERAIRKLKRLSPKYWAASGFDVPTIKRFFSRGNLMEYAKAFEELARAVTNNTDTFGGKITSFFKDIDFGFKSISRYFGFRADTLITFKGGQWEEFLTTLTEVIRGLSGVSIKVYEFAKIIKTQVYPATYGFALALKDALLEVPGAVLSGTKAVLDAIRGFVTGVYQIIKDLVTDFDIKEVFQEATETITDFFDGVRDKSNLDGALDSIKDFGRKVIEVFFEIYDAVIGNSWWTDTVENVIDTSNTLWDKASSGLTRFKKNTINIFKGIFDKSNRMDLNLDDIKSIDFSFTEFKLPKIRSDSFAESIADSLDKAKEFVANFFDAFPSITKAALVGIGGILVALMFPVGVIKSALLTAIVTSLATSGTLIAEQFGAALTGGSLVYEIGYKLGKAAGYFVGTLIREMPKFLNALLGAVASFTRGFLEQMPALGAAVKSVFAVLDAAGGSGPLGLMGSIIFGVGLAKLLSALNILKGPIENVFTIFKNIGNIVFGDSKGKRNGLLSTYFFGALGPTRALSSIGLALSYLGAFDSIFANSQIMNYAAQGGMLYLALTGDKGLDKVKDVMLTKVAKPIVDVLKGIGKNVTSGNKTLYDIFFGDTGTWTERASAAIKSVLDKITNKIVNMATPYVEKSYEFIKTMFLGTNSSATVAAIKENLNQILNFLGAQIGKIRVMIASLDLTSMFSGLSAGPGLKDYQAAMSRAFGATTAKMTAASGLAAKIGGENGLLGRLFMGRYGKAALIATILGVFSSVAFASENASAPGGKEAGGSVFDDIAANWNNLKLENPFAVAAAQIVAVSLPLILGALFVFRAQAIAALSSVFNVGKITSWTGAFIKGIGAIARNFKTIGLAAGAGGIGALIGYKTGGTEMAILGGMLAAELAFSFRRQLARLLVGVASKIFTVAFAKVVAVVTAVAAAGGALYLWFFGEKGQFWRDVGRAKDKVLELVGLGPDKKTSDTGLSEQASKFVKTQQVPITYTLKDINTKALSKGETEKLNKLIADLEGAIGQAIQEEEFTGRVSKDTRDSIGALNRNLVRYSEKLAAKTLPEVENFDKFLDDLQERKPNTRAGEIKLAAEQAGLDIAYRINEGLIRATRLLAVTPPGKRAATERLDKLQSERGTRYNAAYRGRTEGEDNLRRLEGQAKSFEFTSDLLSAEIKKLKNQYVQSAKDLVNAESQIRFSFADMEFKFQELPDSDPIKKRKLELEQQLAKAMEEAVNYDAAMKAITVFQNSLSDLEINLNLIGVTFESNSLFAGTEEAFEKLKKLGEEAKFLADQLENTKNVAEQNAIIVRINEIRTQTNIIKIQAEEQSLERTQFKLRDLASQLGSNLFSDETFRQLSDDTADAFFKQYNDLYVRLESLKVKKPINMAPVGAMEPGKRRDDLLKGLERDQQDYLRSYFQIQDEIRNVERRLQREVSSGPAAIQAKRDVAASVGIDFNKVVSDKGINSAVRGMEQLQGKMDQLRQAERANDTSAVQRLTREINYLIEALNEAPLNLQNFITAIQGLGQNLGLEELASMSAEAYANLKQAAHVTINLDKQMQRMGANISKAEFDKILDKKLKASAAAFEAYLDTLYSTPDKILQAFSRLGMSDNFELSFLSDDAMKSLLEIDTTIVKLQNQLKDPANVSRFREIVAELDDAQQRANALKSTFASFNTRLDIVNRAFGLGLEAEAFASLPSEIQIILSDQAQQLLNDLERLLKTPMSAPKPAATPASVEGVGVSGGQLPEITVTATRVNLPASIKEAFESLRTGAANAKKLVLESGAVLAQAIAKISTSGVTELVSSVVETFPALSEFREALEKISREDLQGLAVIAAQANAVKQKFEQGLATGAEARGAVQSGTAAITTRLAGANYGIDTRIALKRIDVELSQASANLIDATEKALIDNLVREIEAARKDAESATSDKQRIAAQELINAKMEQLDEAIVAATRDAKAKSREAGKAFASSVSDGATSAIQDVLKGEKTLKEGIKGVLDSFTSTVIDTFVQGLMDPFTGENGIITRELRKLGSSLFSSAAGDTSIFGEGSKGLMSEAWGGIKSLFGFGSTEAAAGTASTTVAGASTAVGALGGAACNMCGGLQKTAESITGAIATQTGEQRGIFGSIGDLFTKGLEGLGGLLSSAWQGLSSALGGIWSGTSSNVGSWFTAIAAFFATGGYVSGPGTGTSDSIPAMLSDGEFVINAKSTKKYLPLLQALNSGKLPKFATGGLVGAAVMAAPAMAAIDTSSKETAAPVQQVFQISITGDISRQTRAEIQRMLPNIANGVNAYNREKR